MMEQRCERAVFFGGLRVPFGRAHKGAYKDIRPDDLLTLLLAEQKKRFPDLALRVEDVIAGCAYPEGEQGYNVARMAAIGAGLTAPGMTVNRLCGSSLEAAMIASARVVAGYGTVFSVAGVESMSRVVRRGVGFSESKRIQQGCPMAYITMGETAEIVARRYPEITRTDQEEFSAASHEKADQAFARGDYRKQIWVPDGSLLERDEGVRVPVDRKKMTELKPTFLDDGVVTAATSSPLSDGATAGWVMAESLFLREAQSLGLASGLVICDVSWAHIAPEVMGLGPIPAVQKLLKRNGLSIQQIEAIEMNEAFAVQSLACAQELHISLDKLNSWGGAIAMGHPLGASGLRLLMTLHARLEKSGKPGALGIATLCVGGGQGMAVLGKLAVI